MPINARNRLASVMGKCFPTVTGATRDALRHAALSQKLGREVASSADLTDDEIKTLLTEWEHYDAPFSPSEKAMKTVNELAQRYQTEHGQAQLL
jgi:hypothetical protein